MIEHRPQSIATTSRLQSWSQFVGSLTVELDNENGGGIAIEEIAQPGRLGIQLGAVKDVLIDHFDGGRPMGQDGGGGPHLLK